MIVSIIQKCSIVGSYLFSYDDIVDFELLEDNEIITKGGLESAVVGAALFGSIEAIVETTTGGKTKCFIFIYKISNS